MIERHKMMDAHGMRKVCYSNDVAELEKKYAEAVELLEYFTDRVEEGSIRSRATYEKYKSFLAALSP